MLVGKGRFAKHLSKRGINVFGVDMSAKLLDQFIGTDKKKGSILNIEVSDSYFDGAYTIEVVEHLPSLIENAIKELHRVVKPGCKVVIIDKNKEINSGKEKWEDWFREDEVKKLMNKYFKHVISRRISDLFICWVGVK